MQSDRNGSKTDTFYEPTTHKLHVWTSYETIITFARHKYELLGVFTLKMGSMIIGVKVMDSKSLFFNCSHLIASLCTTFLLFFYFSDEPQHLQFFTINH